MLHPTKLLRAAVATTALTLAAGCAQQAPPAQATAANVPVLAGAWYQIYFDTNSSAINARGQSIVNNAAYIATNVSTARVTVIGKTDRVGAPPANMALSMQRADAVRNALIADGVPAGRIDTSWTGEEKQQVGTAGDVAEARDRVVDVTVVKQPASP